MFYLTINFFRDTKKWDLPYFGFVRRDNFQIVLAGFFFAKIKLVREIPTVKKNEA